MTVELLFVLFVVVLLVLGLHPIFWLILYLRLKA